MNRIVAVLLLAVATTIFSCTPADNEAVSYTHSFETVEDDPTGTLVYTLENGLKVYLSVNKLEPRIQSYIAVRAGSKFDPAETTGLAHYLEHMVFKGTHKMGTRDWESERVILDEIAATFEAHKEETDPAMKEQLYLKIDSLSLEASNFAIANEYDKMVSSLGAKGTNAYTSNDETVYVNDIPSNELEKWMMVESERFQTLVLRLFHTELETVYEEFNRAQDTDGRWVYQKVMEGLMPNHPYGTQTTLGLGEHLKNPSMYNIYEYFNTYYRPNNVAICLAGDLDPDATIDLIETYFGSWEPGDIPEFEMPEKTTLTSPVEMETYGPQQEMLYLGYKFPGAGTYESDMARMVDMLLANSQAGLIDLNLNLEQKVLSAGSYPQVLHDHTVHLLYGMPKQGQSLEEVRDLLLGELEKIKEGEFDDWLVTAVVNDLKLNRMKAIESNSGRAKLMVDAFINELPFEQVIFEYDNMAGITKEDIVAFVKEHYKDNYVVSYKRMGESDRHSVPKPQITPLTLDRESKSEFYVEFEAMPSEPLSPNFIDFEEDIAFSEVNGLPMAYIKNEQNGLFNLYYIFDMGSDNDKELALAISYLPYLGTSEYSASELKQEFYKLAMSFDVSASRDEVYVSLSGLEENLDAGIDLFEHILSDVVADPDVYLELISDIQKSRMDAKLDKRTILRSGLASYTKYGPTNPFTDKLSIAQLQEIDIESLTNQIHVLSDYQHRIFYYGAQDLDKVKGIIAKHHEAGAMKEPKPAVEYPENDFTSSNVYFTPYDMQQVELWMISKDEPFNPEVAAAANLFNEYFGAGLSSIVFQEIREQKALAYSAFSYYSTPRKQDENHYVYAYLGTQSDKMEDAIDAMMEIINEMPEAEMQFEAAKEAVVKKLQTDWVTGSSVYWQYEKANKLGLDYDSREKVYEQIQTMTLSDLNAFFKGHIANKNFSFCVIGNEDLIDKEVLKSLGDYRQLTLEEVFGY